MAEGNGESAKELLRNCAKYLADAMSSLSGKDNQSTSASTSNNKPSTDSSNSNQNSDSAESSRSCMTRIEHQRLFGYQPSKSSNYNHATVPSNGRKRRHTGKYNGSGPSKKGKTYGWKHKFFCFSSRKASVAPDVNKKMNLYAAGLGELEVTTDRDGDASALDASLCESFPALKSCGGYEILRTASTGSRHLEVIKVPVGGYTPSYLRSILGQARGYIRPIQKDLVCVKQEANSSEVNQDYQCEKCLNCEQFIPLSQLRCHISSCSKESKQLTIQVESDIEEQLESESDNQLNHDKGVPTCLTGMKVVDSDVESASTMSMLKEICPQFSETTIQEALFQSNGDVGLAAELLVQEDSEINEETSKGMYLDGKFPSVLTYSAESPEESIKKYRIRTIETHVSREWFSVSRLGWIEELKQDILSHYKNPNKKLKALPRVRFEGEEGLGTGPVKEFFSSSIKIPQEGLGGDSRPMIFFEGSEDHLIPIHNPPLRQTGAYKAIGRIIGHSVLHGGPSVHGLSESVKHYWAFKDLSSNPPTLTINDIPDIDLREYVRKLMELPRDVSVDDDLKSLLIGYIIEAGLDPGLLNTNRSLLQQHLLMYYIIEKRKQELDDIAKGMNEVGLMDLLQQCPEVLPIVFPRKEDIKINLQDFRNKIKVDANDEDSTPSRTHFFQYLSELGENKEGLTLSDLCRFWTGSYILPPRNEMMAVKFEKDLQLPMAETCFLVLSVPGSCVTFDLFKSKMDTALKYGCEGFSFS